MKIENLIAREILDSRGQPTVEVDLHLSDGNGALKVGRASVPSGASVGSMEALELRDFGSSRYMGRGVIGAVYGLNDEVRNVLVGRVFDSQRQLDDFLINYDGTPNKSRLGANSLLAVSLAFAKARAKILGLMLFESIDYSKEFLMPRPMLNIINGGAHARNNVAFQEFMIVPARHFGFSESLEAAYRIFTHLNARLQKHGLNVGIGDEGGFAPDLESVEQAFDFLMMSIRDAGFVPGDDISIALDVAANELYLDGVYRLSNDIILNTSDLLGYYEKLVKEYPIISIEDPFSEYDSDGWRALTKVLRSKILVIGDDLFVTNTEMLKKGIDSGLANAILIKMNQIGTLSETLDAIRLAAQNDYTYIISHRSGETEDSSMSHLAVATSSKYIKAGSICRTDRVCKYNELLRIKEKL